MSLTRLSSRVLNLGDFPGRVLIDGGALWSQLGLIRDQAGPQVAWEVCVLSPWACWLPG